MAKSKKSVFLLTIQLLVVFAFVVFILFNPSTTVKDKRGLDDVTEEEEKALIEKVEYINIENLEKKLSMENSGVYYSVDVYKNKYIQDEWKISIVLTELLDEFELYEENVVHDKNCKDVIYRISEDRFKEEYKKYFYNELRSYKTEDPFKYEDGYFYYRKCPGYKGGYVAGYLTTYIESVKKDDEYYYVFQYVGYVANNKVYNDLRNTDKVYKKIKDNEKFYITKNNYEDFAPYKITYKKVDGEFLLVEIERTK